MRCLFSEDGWQTESLDKPLCACTLNGRINYGNNEIAHGGSYAPSAVPYRTGFIRVNSGNGAQSSGRCRVEDDKLKTMKKKKSGIRCSTVWASQTFDREYLASSAVCGYLIEICIFMVSQYRQQQSGSIDPILHALCQMNKYLVELLPLMLQPRYLDDDSRGEYCWLG